MNDYVDPSFAERVASYQKKARRGVAFEAAGTVGGKPVRPARAAWRMHPIRRILRVLSFVLVLKVTLFHAAYTLGYKVKEGLTLDSMTAVQRAYQIVFYPDPISVEISRLLNIGQMHFANELRKIL